MLQFLLAVFWLLLIPFGCGLWITSRMPKEHQSIGVIYLNGHLIMMALFQCFYVAFFLAGSISFKLLTWVFGIFIVLFAFTSAWFGRTIIKESFLKVRGKEALLWKIGFGLLLVMQLVMRLMQQVSDGDDAYYIATASQAYTGGTMNMVAPYTGYVIAYIDYRHVLACAPIWLAFFSKVTMIPPVVMGHSVMSLILILLHYIVVLSVGELLFDGKKKQKYLFAVLVSLLNVYGYVSIYTAQTFFLMRTWQGKSIFANLLIPAMFLVLLWMGERGQKKRTEYANYILAGVIMLAGSGMTMIAVAVLPLIYILGILFLSIARKKPIMLLKGALACIPVGVIGLLYILF